MASKPDATSKSKVTATTSRTTRRSTKTGLPPTPTKVDDKDLKRKATTNPSTDLITDTQLELLRKFDLNSQYGPGAGMTRMLRWKRAEQLGLEPPQVVFDLLTAHSGDVSVQQHIWHEFTE